MDASNAWGSDFLCKMVAFVPLGPIHGGGIPEMLL